MMTQNVQSLTCKIRALNPEKLTWGDPRGESPAADLLLQGGATQFALSGGDSIYTLVKSILFTPLQYHSWSKTLAFLAV